MARFEIQGPVLIAGEADREGGYEVWAAFDASAAVWECFASPECDDYIGCCDTLDEARGFARQWMRDRRAEG